MEFSRPIGFLPQAAPRRPLADPAAHRLHTGAQNVNFRERIEHLRVVAVHKLNLDVLYAHQSAAGEQEAVAHRKFADQSAVVQGVGLALSARD